MYTFFCTVAGLKNLPFVRRACSLKKLTRLKVSCGSHKNKKIQRFNNEHRPCDSIFNFHQVQVHMQPSLDSKTSRVTYEPDENKTFCLNDLNINSVYLYCI